LLVGTLQLRNLLSKLYDDTTFSLAFSDLNASASAAAATALSLTPAAASCAADSCLF